MFKHAVSVARTIALAYGIVMILAVALEDRLVYMPSQYPAGNWNTDPVEVDE